MRHVQFLLLLGVLLGSGCLGPTSSGEGDPRVGEMTAPACSTTDLAGEMIGAGTPAVGPVPFTSVFRGSSFGPFNVSLEGAQINAEVDWNSSVEVVVVLRLQSPSGNLTEKEFPPMSQKGAISAEASHATGEWLLGVSPSGPASVRWRAAVRSCPIQG